VGHAAACEHSAVSGAHAHGNACERRPRHVGGVAGAAAATPGSVNSACQWGGGEGGASGGCPPRQSPPPEACGCHGGGSGPVEAPRGARGIQGDGRRTGNVPDGGGGGAAATDGVGVWGNPMRGWSGGRTKGRRHARGAERRGAAETGGGWRQHRHRGDGRGAGRLQHRAGACGPRKIQSIPDLVTPGIGPGGPLMSRPTIAPREAIKAHSHVAQGSEHHFRDRPALIVGL